MDSIRTIMKHLKALNTAWFTIVMLLPVIGVSQEIEKILFQDNFSNDLSNWTIEQTKDGTTHIHDGSLEIDGGGCTVWFNEILNGSVLIEYEATLIQNGGKNDNCRDLNCFVMARHPRAPYDLFEGWRSNSKTRAGNFKEYHELRTYYAGIGGHKNTTTRFRRYTGHGGRPLLEEHDLIDPKHMLEANTTYKIQIVANNNIIQLYRNGDLFFELNDPQPYTSGWFGFRTVANHVKINNFKVYRLAPEKLSKKELFCTAKKLGINKSLTELSFRTGQRNKNEFKHGESYLSEKLVFTDYETGGNIWQMTNDPAIETNEYTDIPVWSADGESMLFISARNGENERWLMDANGENLRPLSNAVDLPGDKGVWSIKYPDILYYAEKEYEGDKVIATKVMTANIKTGKKQVVVKVPRDLGKLMPPHPSENLFLFGDHMGGEWTDKEHPSRAFIVDRKGKISEVKFEKLYHRLRFTKSDDGRIFFNFDRPRTTWTCMPDGSERKEIEINGGHPDWIEGGEWVIFNAREVLSDGTKNFDLRYDAIRFDGTGFRTIYPYGGHASTCTDGLHIVCDGGPGSGSVNYVNVDTNNTSQNLFMNHTSRFDHSNNWHPNHHSTHPHPNASPDGTKVMSNSDVLGQYANVFVSIAKYPDAPQNLNARLKGKSIMLSWDKAKNSRETAGYNLYYSENSGKGFFKINSELIKQTKYTVASSYKGYFIVAAVEYSGLQSAPTNETYYNGNTNWQGFARLAFEAELGQCVLPFEPKMEMQNASNGYIVKARNGEAKGQIKLEVNVPADGDYILWAFATGRGNVRVKFNGDNAGSFAGSEGFWSWQKIQTPVSLKKGKVTIELTGESGTEEMDKFYLTNDLSFQPLGLSVFKTVVLTAPTGLSAKGISNNSIQLKWHKAENAIYYNVYASSNPDFECNQHHLVGSPIEATFIDWGLNLNENYYYKVKSVDVFGNESDSFSGKKAKVQHFIPSQINLNVSDAKANGMEQVYEKQLGEMVWSTSSENGLVEWEFEIPVEGDYTIWGQSVIDVKEKLKYELTLDEVRTEWQVLGLYNTWKYSPIGEKTSGSAQTFHLTKGVHKISIKTNKGNVLGAFIISNNPAFYPVNEMKSTGY